jgi:hypothetical protein
MDFRIGVAFMIQVKLVYLNLDQLPIVSNNKKCDVEHYSSMLM